ncbi:MAG: hypothetical protein V4754_05385 [Pseudomonadota bacterium]
MTTTQTEKHMGRFGHRAGPGAAAYWRAHSTPEPDEAPTPGPVPENQPPPEEVPDMDPVPIQEPMPHQVPIKA